MIKIESVTFKHQNGTVALQNVSLEIRTGEATAIVGENGAGKTTLVKHLNGLIKPTEGKVTVFDLDTKQTTVAQLARKVGVVFQNPDHQLFSETVSDEIAFGLRNFGFPESVIKKRLEWALEFFGLTEYRDSSPMMLSGGEKKRLCLAIVLAWDPEVIVLDEPTVGQDLVQKEKLREVIKMLLLRGKTVILVSHDMEFVWSLQPRVIVMAKGRVVADGAAAEVFSRPEVVGEANLMKPQLLELSVHLKNPPQKPFADIYEARQWLVSSVSR
ncbi:MAG: energy-coupling factor ABC transporter ATP-binding protein [Thaumarchaeota archaeon]|nr:energy-coupling factor ABC transporter ATP-binding protein [Nitrososphaerota archaeon]